MKLASRPTVFIGMSEKDLLPNNSLQVDYQNFYTKTVQNSLCNPAQGLEKFTGL
jgi:hypothetical protein